MCGVLLFLCGVLCLLLLEPCVDGGVVVAADAESACSEQASLVFGGLGALLAHDVEQPYSAFEGMMTTSL